MVDLLAEWSAEVGIVSKVQFGVLRLHYLVTVLLVLVEM